MRETTSIERRATQAQNPESRAPALVSVIIPALNEEKVIGRCLDALRQMSVAAEVFEVIVVDNGSTDNTCTVALKYAPSLDLRILEKRNAPISALRNFGAAAARGTFLAFLDADCLVPKDWLIFGVQALSAGDAGIVGAHCRIPLDSSWVARSWCNDGHANLKGQTSYIPTGDMLIGREVFLKLGGFDESLETNEDYEFCQRARAAGLSILAFPQLEVIHLGTPQTLTAFYRQSRWHGRHVFKVFLRSLPSLRNARPVLYAIYMLVAMAAVLVGTGVAIASGRVAVLLVSLGVLLAGPLTLSTHKAYERREVRLVAPLVLLFLLYGIARATCLLPWSAWVRSEGHRRRKPHLPGASRDSSLEKYVIDEKSSRDSLP